jgi:hypothetical protein
VRASALPMPKSAPKRAAAPSALAQATDALERLTAGRQEQVGVAHVTDEAPGEPWMSFQRAYVRWLRARAVLDDPDVSYTDEEGKASLNEARTPPARCSLCRSSTRRCLSTLFPPTPSKVRPPTIAPSWRSVASRRTCYGSALAMEGQHNDPHNPPRRAWRTCQRLGVGPSRRHCSRLARWGPRFRSCRLSCHSRGRIRRGLGRREEAYDDVDGEVGGTAYHRTSGIARAILATRATSLADFRIKARALLWCYSDDYEEMVEVLFDPAETTDVRLLRSIVADLLAPRPQTGGAAKA